MTDITIGIYAIVNKINKDFYIGCTGNTVGVSERLEQHFGSLERGDHYNKRLQRSYNKYGYSAFAAGTVEIVEWSSELTDEENRDILESREQYWIDTLLSKYGKKMVNGKISVDGHWTISDEVRQNISNGTKSWKRKIRSRNTRKISATVERSWSKEY